jgi:hypothetical protein
MASWTTPKTVVSGSAALSSDWNTYIRDNSQYLKDEVESAFSAAEAAEASAQAAEASAQAANDRIQILTQAEYDEISPDPETIYIIVG